MKGAGEGGRGHEKAEGGRPWTTGGGQRLVTRCQWLGDEIGSYPVTSPCVVSKENGRGTCVRHTLDRNVLS